MKIELSKQDGDNLIELLNTVEIKSIQNNAIFMRIIGAIQKGFEEDLKNNKK